MKSIYKHINFLNDKPNSKFILMVLFGEYIRVRGGEIWLQDLLHLLDLVGVGEHTGRSTISRMAKEGFFEIEKDGRNSLVTLTEHGKSILRGGDLRVNEAPSPAWDGRWHMVAYSLPEGKRKQRNSLRKQLTWLGYGSLGPGLWISPHDRFDELLEILTSLGIKDSVHLLSGNYAGPLTTAELVTKCWDLNEIDVEFGQFDFYYRNEVLESWKNDQVSDPSTAFVTRFMMTAHLFPILQKDPNLPQEMLPKDWSGTTARNLFLGLREDLEETAGQFIDSILTKTKVR